MLLRAVFLYWRSFCKNKLILKTVCSEVAPMMISRLSHLAHSSVSRRTRSNAIFARLGTCLKKYSFLREVPKTLIECWLDIESFRRLICMDVESSSTQLEIRNILIWISMILMNTIGSFKTVKPGDSSSLEVLHHQRVIFQEFKSWYWWRQSSQVCS